MLNACVTDVMRISVNFGNGRRIGALHRKCCPWPMVAGTPDIVGRVADDRRP